MPAIRVWVKRLLKPIRARRLERDMEDEMRAHIEMEVDALTQSGVAPEEARRQALATFGGVARFRDDARDAWPMRWASDAAADIRFALRSLRHSPGFTLAAIVALAAGMGANTAVFSAVDSVAFRPLAIRAPQELVALYATQGEAKLLSFSYPTFEDIRRDSRAFSDVAAVTEGPVNVGDQDPTVMWAAHVSDNYFTMLGLAPALGALLRPGDAAAPVVVLSYSLWKERFGASSAAIGRKLVVNGAPFTIVGVAPAQFTGTRLFTYEPAVWLPIGMHAQTIPASDGLMTDRAAARFLLLGRRRDGVGMSRAADDVKAVARRLEDAFPDLYRALAIQLVANRTPINPWLAPPERIALIGQLSVLGTLLVLLIACANVASLLLARMAARREEIAIRLALGASRRRLAQQLLTESLVLATLGAIAAVPVAMLAARGVLGLTPPLDYASSWRPADGPRMLAFSTVLTIGAAVLFGLAPVVQAIGRGAGAGLRESTPLTAGSHIRVGFRELIVVGQVALSVAVLATAGLFARSFREAHRLETGIVPDGAVAFTLDPQLLPTYDAVRTRRLYRDVVTRIAALPGVDAVGRAMSVPLDGNGSARHVFVDGGPTTPDRAPAAEFNLTTPGYFRAIGTRVVDGRDFTRGDSASRLDVVIVNDVLARRLWPGESPIGKTIRIDSPAGPVSEIVGVVRVSNYRTLGERPRAAIWRDLDRVERSRSTIVVRSSASDTRLVGAIRATMREIDPAVPVIGLATLRDHIALAYTPVESGALGATAFGVLAVLLTASGIYGVVSYGVSQRRREIGIRAALGARAGDVVRLVVGRAVRLTLVGVAIGLATVALVPMGLNRLLYGVSSHDPATLGATGLLFLLVAGIAGFVPARRAARLDPMRVLRLTTIVLVAAGVGARAQAPGSTPLELGKAAYREHRSDEAIELFEKAVALHDDSVAPHLWLGRAYVQALPQANFVRKPVLARRARSQFDRAVELDPRDVEVREDRATYYMYAPSIAGGGMDRARAEAEVARSLNPYRGALLRGQIEEYDKNVSGAEREYATLVAANPDSAAPFNRLVGLYQSERRFGDAFAAVDRRLGQRGDDSWGTYQLGKTAALSGERLEQGEAALRKYIAAARFDPSATEAHARWRLGMILEQRHDAPRARAEYEAALRLDPRLADAKRALERLP